MLFNFGLFEPQNLSDTGVLSEGGCVPDLLGITLSASFPQCLNQEITIDANVQEFNNSVVSWSWDLGDGNSSNDAEEITHSYDAIGPYTITLTIEDENGEEQIYTQEIFVGSCAIDNPSHATWIFGQQFVLDFSTGVPLTNSLAIDNNSMTEGHEAVVTQSNPNGELLFYGTPTGFWDGNHQFYDISTILPILINSNNIGPNQIHSANSISQMISVPSPGEENTYHIFVPPLYLPNDPNPQQMLDQFQIQVLADGSLTFLEAENTPILSEALEDFLPTEKITAIPHCNGHDYWIIGQLISFNTFPFTAKIYTFLLTEDGLSHPDLSNNLPRYFPEDDIDGTINSLEYLGLQVGKIKASPDGTRIGITSIGTFENMLSLYDFNNHSGLISNEVILSEESRYYGISFSSNSAFLYTSNSVDLNTFQIKQFDLSDLSENIIHTTPTTVQGLQLGPDDNIYALSNSTLATVISSSNTTNPIVNPQSVPIFPNPSGAGAWNFPSFIDAEPVDFIAPSFQYTFTDCNEIELVLDHLCWEHYGIQWDFGEGTVIGPALFDTPINLPNVSGTFGQPIFTHNTSANLPVSVILFANDTPVPVTQSVQSIPFLGNFNIFGNQQVCQDIEHQYWITPIENISYEWTITGGLFENGTTTSTNTNHQIVWNDLSNASITVTATHPDPNCDPITETILINVEDCPPIDCDLWINQVCVDNGIQLTLFQSDDTPYVLQGNETVVWNIDGNSSTTNVPSILINDQNNFAGSLDFVNTYCNINIPFTQDLSLDCCAYDDITPINTPTIWNNLNFSVDEEIIVPSGSLLYLSNTTIKFSPNGFITVEPGAQLIINNSTLTNLGNSICSSSGMLWPGINVEGDGHVRVWKSEISFAETAIYGFHSFDDILFIQNSRIVNCPRGVDIFSSKGSITYQILSSIFQSDSESHTHVRFREIEHAIGCRIEGNIFSDAKFGIQGRELRSQTLHISKNRFIQISLIAVDYRNTVIPPFSSSFYLIEGNQFFNIRDGIFLSKTHRGWIRENRIANVIRYGMAIRDIVAYEISYNEIYGNLSSTSWRAGIHFIGSTLAQQSGGIMSIDNNYIRSFKQAITFRDYISNSHHIRLDCNRFEDNTRGIRFTGITGTTTIMDAFGSPTAPVFNQFINNGFDLEFIQQSGAITILENYYYPICEPLDCSIYQPTVGGNGQNWDITAVKMEITEPPCRNVFFKREIINQLFKQVQISPNPSQGMVNISVELNSSQSQEIAIRLFSIQGQALHSQTQRVTVSDQIPLDLSHFPSGMYLIHIQLGEEFITQKITLLK